VLSRQRQELEVLNGRLDRQRIRLLLTRILPAGLVDEFFLCGPDGMLRDAEAALKELGVPPERVRIERFTPAAPALAGAPEPGSRPELEPRSGARVTLVIDGTRHGLTVAPGETIIEAGLRAGLDLPFSCRAGMCCTCRAKLLEGEVAMRENYGLEPWEVAAGYVLTCQAEPRSAEVTVDYDQV
jgi:ring-1,2-phenylacetyl-CoA epoxidase subunit PaaE